MKIEIFIFNYGKFNDALNLYNTFTALEYKSFILNCESPTDPPFRATDTIIKLPNIYYSGQWNETLKLASGDVIFLINSDVQIPDAPKLMRRLEKFYQYYEDKAGIYAPDHYWTPWTYNPNLLKSTTALDLKEVPATDSTLWSLRKDVADEVGLIDTNLNLFGWGIEIVAAYKCFKQNKLVVRDYRVKCNHPQSTAYNRQQADKQWRNWVQHLGLGKEFWDYYNTRSKYGFGWKGTYKPNPVPKFL